MHKIANSSELQTEILRVLAMAQKPNPSRTKLASELNNLADRVAAGSPPPEILKMLMGAVTEMKRRIPIEDIVNRKEAVGVWGSLFSVLHFWTLDTSNPNYSRNKDFFKSVPVPSEESVKWLKSVNDARHGTLVKQALQKAWPEFKKLADEYNLK
jgi:hypothetical protein